MLTTAILAGILAWWVLTAPPSSLFSSGAQLSLPIDGLATAMQLLQEAAATRNAGLATPSTAAALELLTRAETSLRAAAAHPQATPHERYIALVNLAEHLQHPLAGSRREEAQRILEALYAATPESAELQARLGFVQMSLCRTQPAEASCNREGVALLARALESTSPSGRHAHLHVTGHYAMLVDTYLRLNQTAAAAHWAERGTERGHFPHPMQRPYSDVHPAYRAPAEWRLRPQAWWSQPELPSSTQALWQELEENYQAIARESRGVLMRADMQLNRTGDLRLFRLKEDGEELAGACGQCPVTCGVLHKYPEAQTLGPGPAQVQFSRIVGGTVLYPHCGTSNMKLRLHLALDVPEAAGSLRLQLCVLEQCRSWVEGSVFVFDDSIQHHVVFEAPPSVSRTVLIVDIWHPDMPLEPLST